MTNPNNAIGTPAAFKGRTSVKAFNNLTQSLSKGIVSGWACSPVSGMTVAVGGTSGTRDVAIAEDASGNRTTISNISEAPVEVNISAAPSTYSRIDSIVAYVNASPEGDQSTQDNPAACGICVAKGTAAANPVEPNNSTIRSAITTDGGIGTTAYYVVLAKITIASGTTSISSGIITQGSKAETGAPVPSNSITAEQLKWSTIPHVFKDSGNLTITCPKTGTYLIFAQMSWNPPSGQSNVARVCTIKKNGSTALAEGVDSRAGAGDWGNISVKAIASLTSGDTLSYYDENNTLISGGVRNNIGMIYIGS